MAKKQNLADSNPIFAQSRFVSDAEGWKVLAGYPASPQTLDPTWSQLFGNFGAGFIIYQSSQSTTLTNCFFSAPQAFLGNISGAYGFPLRFELVIQDTSGGEEGTFYTGNQDIIIAGPSDALYFNVEVADTYQHPDLGPVQVIQATLNETSGCVLKSTGEAPTQQQFKDILNNVQALLVRADYFESATSWQSALGMVTLYGNAIDPMLRALQTRLQTAYNNNPDQLLLLNADNIGTDGAGIITLFQNQLAANVVTLGNTVTIQPDSANNKLVVSGTSQDDLLGLTVPPVQATFGVNGSNLDIVMTMSATEGWQLTDNFPLLQQTILPAIAFSEDTLPVITLTGPPPAQQDDQVVPLTMQAVAGTTGILNTVVQLVSGAPASMSLNGPVKIAQETNVLDLSFTLPSFTLTLPGFKTFAFNVPAIVIHGLGVGQGASTQLEAAFRVQSNIEVGGVTLPLAVQLPGGLYGWTFMTIPGSTVPVSDVPAFIAAMLPGDLGTALSGMIPQTVKTILDKFAITDFAVAMKSDLSGFNSLNLRIESQTGKDALWPVLPGIVELDSVGFALSSINYSSGTETRGAVWGSMTLSDNLKLSAYITLPIGTGNWLFSASTIQPFGLTDVSKLLGGNQLASMLPDSLAAVTGLMLNDLSVSYDPVNNTLDNFNLDIGTVSAWNIVPDRQVSVKQFGLQLSVAKPLDNSNRALTGQVGGTMSIGSVDVTVNVQKATAVSDWILTVQSDDIVLPSLGELTTIMGGTQVSTLIPDTIRDNHFILRTIGLTVNISQQKLDNFNFQLYSPDNWVIIDNDVLSISEPALFLDCDWSSGSLVATGGVSATLTFIGSDFYVSAEKKANPDTWLLSCTMDTSTPLNLTQAVQKYISGATLPTGFPDIVLAEAAVTYDTASSEYHFSGLVNLQNPDDNKPWGFNIGPAGIAIKGIGLDVTGKRDANGNMQSPVVKITGGLKICDTVSFDISYVVGGELKISGVLIDGQTQVNLKDLVTSLCSSDASTVTWISGFPALDAISFTNVYLDFTIGDNLLFTVGGTMLINTTEVDVLFVLQKTGANWEFAFGVKISMDTNWTIPGFTDGLSTFSISQATWALVASSFTDPFTLPPSFNLPQVQTVDKGLSFYAIFNFNTPDTRFTALKEVLPSDMTKGTLTVHGLIADPLAKSYVEVVLSADNNGVALMGWDQVRLSLFSLRLYAEPSIALHGEFKLMMITDQNGQPLKLVMELYASPNAIGIRFIPSEPFHDRPVIIAWVNALGISGLTFFLTDLDLSIIPEGPSLSGLVGGGVDFTQSDSNTLSHAMTLDPVLVKAAGAKRLTMLAEAATTGSDTFCDMQAPVDFSQPMDTNIRVEGKVGFLVVPESPEPVIPNVIGVKLVNFTLPYMLKRFVNIDLPQILFPVLFPEICFLVSLDPKKLSSLLHFEFSGQIVVYGFHGQIQALCTQERIMFNANMDPIHFSVNSTNIVTIQRSSTDAQNGPIVYIDSAPVAPAPNVYASVYCSFFDVLHFEGSIYLKVDTQNPVNSYFEITLNGNAGQLLNFNATLAYDKAQYILVDASFSLLLDTDVSGFSLNKDGQNIKVADQIKLKGSGIYLAAELYMSLDNRGASPNFTFYANGTFEIKEGSNCDVTLHLELGTQQNPLQVSATTISDLPSTIFSSMSSNAASIFSALFQSAECFYNYLKKGLILLEEGAEVAKVFADYFKSTIEKGAEYLSDLGHAVKDVSDWLWDIFGSKDTDKNTKALKDTDKYSDDDVAEAVKDTSDKGGDPYTPQKLINDQYYAGYKGAQATNALVTLFTQYTADPVGAGQLVSSKYSYDQVAAGLKQSFASRTAQASDMYALLTQIYTGGSSLTAQQMANALAPYYPAAQVAAVLRTHYPSDTDTAAKMATLLITAYQACSKPLDAPGLAAALAPLYAAADVAKVLKDNFPDQTGTPSAMAGILQTAYTAAGHALDAPTMTGALANAPFTAVQVAPEIHTLFPSDTTTALKMGQLLYNAYASLQSDPATMVAALAAVPYPAGDIAEAIKQLYNQQFQTAVQMATFLAQQHYAVTDTAHILKTLYPAATGTPSDMATLLQNAYGASNITASQMASAFAASPYTAPLAAPVLKQLYSSDIPNAEAMAALLIAAYTQPPIDANTMAQALAATPYTAADTAGVIQTHYASTVPDAAAMAAVLHQAPYNASDVAPVIKTLYPSQTQTAAQMAAILAGVTYTAVQIATPLKTLYASELANASDMATLLAATYTSPAIDMDTMAQALAVSPYTPQQSAPALYTRYGTQLQQPSAMADLLVLAYTAPVMTAAVMADALGACAYPAVAVAQLLKQRYAADTDTALKLAGLLYNAYQSPVIPVQTMLQALAAVGYNAWMNGPAMQQYYSSTSPNDLALALVQTYASAGALSPVTLGTALTAAQVSQQALTGAILAGLPGTSAGVVAVVLLLVNDSNITNALTVSYSQQQQGKTMAEAAVAVMQSASATAIPVLCAALMSVYTPPNASQSALAQAVCAASSGAGAADVAKGIMALFPALTASELLQALKAGWAQKQQTLSPDDAATGLVAGFAYLTLPLSQTDVATALVQSYNPITPAQIAAALITAFASQATVDSVLIALRAALPSMVPVTAAITLTAAFNIGESQVQLLANALSSHFTLTLAPNTVACMAMCLMASNVSLSNTAAALKIVYGQNWTPDDYSIVLGVFNNQIWQAAVQALNQGQTPQVAAPALKTAYPTTNAGAMCSVLASTYNMIVTTPSVVPMAQSMKAAGYQLQDTAAAMKTQYEPDWTPQDYQEVLQVYQGS